MNLNSKAPSDNSSDKLICLADRQELIPTLSDWFYKEWSQNFPDLTQATIEVKLRERLNRDKIPLVQILLRDDSPIASASLKLREMETHPHYPHWLGSVYVLPEFRGGGIGTYLVKYAVAKAKQIEVETLYLYTRSKEDFYKQLGWQTIERPLYRGRQVAIMRQILSK